MELSVNASHRWEEKMTDVLYIVVGLVLLAVLLVIGIACYQTRQDPPTWFEREQQTARRWSVSDPLME
jgi:di/tricarboxylate transporter